MTGKALDSLPGDVIILILKSLPNRRSLKAAVHASPIIHTAYLAARRGILQAVLCHQHGGLVIMSDAIAAVRSTGLSACKAEDKEQIIALLDRWRRSLYDKPADTDEVASLLHLHDLATWFLEDFTKTMIAPIWIPETTWSTMKPLKLSKRETRRFFRGFYRLQIWSNIFGNAVCDRTSTRIWNGVFTADKMIRLFFLTMPPWEMEEICCVWELLRNRVKPFYTQAANAVCEHASREIRIYSGQLDNFSRYHPSQWATTSRYDGLGALVTKGPAFVFGLLRKSARELESVIPASLMPRTKSFEWLLSLENPFDFVAAWPPPAQALVYPADIYKLGNFQQFKRHVATLPEEKQPNGCWMYGGSIQIDRSSPGFLHRILDIGPWYGPWQWGYAFWDRHRIFEWNVPDYAFPV
ncbi:hypothetical protein BJX61DRAFT_337817 [Aspergillus egyptiacus]|nr:hypothetical protein BJX61DRAFT_337817 [Aspergillus egyptiacus]